MSYRRVSTKKLTFTGAPSDGSGVHVIFSAPGLKIHAKLFLISRKEGDEVVRYAHIGTGNFNEKTARIYTDYSLLTADARITNEVRRVLNFIENPYRPVSFDYLLVSPQNSRRLLYDMIDKDRQCPKGQPSGITLKLNNPVDKGLVDCMPRPAPACRLTC